MAETEFRKRIGQKIKAARERQGLSQKDLSKIFDADQSYISNLENGHKNASVKTLHKIADVLNIEFDELIEGPRDKDPLSTIQRELLRLNQYIVSLEEENRSLKQLQSQFEVLKQGEFADILGLLRKANPRVRSLTHTLLAYGTLSKEEIEEKEREFGLVLKTVKTTMNEV